MSTKNPGFSAAWMISLPMISLRAAKLCNEILGTILLDLVAAVIETDGVREADGIYLCTASTAY